MLTWIDRDTFLEHLYALRFLQRMDLAFAVPTKLYQHCLYNKRRVLTVICRRSKKLIIPRIQHVQIGYTDGTEKSYIYPYIYIAHSLVDGSPTLAGGMKPNDKAVLFREYREKCLS